MNNNFVSGDIVRHFKRETVSQEKLKEEPNMYLYEIIGTATNTETKEKVMIYKPLYHVDCIDDTDFAARPLEMFMSEVDHEKYPDIKQKYRFEKYEK